jgi:fibronectin type 3 domain-containing protein
MHKFRNHCCRAVCGLLLAVVCLAFGSAGAQGVPIGTTHSVTLTWLAPSPVGGSGTISGYNVYRSPLSAANFAKLNTAVTVGLTFTDSSVSAGTSYNYCVTTVDSLGEESICSAPATANVPANPNAPSGLAVTAK